MSTTLITTLGTFFGKMKSESGRNAKKDCYQNTPLFDRDWYIARNPDLSQLRGDPLDHYLRFGWRERRDPSPFFSLWTYFTLYPHVRAMGEEPLHHYLTSGQEKFLIPNPVFDPAWYVARYIADAELQSKPFEHFLEIGADQGFWPHPLLDLKWFSLSLNRPELSGSDAYKLFLTAESVQNPNAFFDASWYLRENPDVIESGLHPVLHYFAYGALEGRDPSPHFQSAWYMREYPDVAASGMNPLVHFLHYGRKEGRRARQGEEVSIKSVHEALSRLRLDSFMASDSRIKWPSHSGYPDISVVLILYNKANLTFDCLMSMLAVVSAEKSLKIEIILFDNASVDATPRLLDRIENAKIVRSAENVGFVEGVNRAVDLATAPLLLLLNNDTQVSFGSIDSASRLLNEDRTIGAVGGRLILPDGTVQEAGSIVWRDGSCVGVGRGLGPTDAEIMFQRDVDYCSGAFLMTRSQLFRDLGKFDRDFAPAYYEEVDYCTRLWENGYRVVYDPSAVVLHFEFGSAASREWAVRQQKKNQAQYVAKHAGYLASKFLPSADNIMLARFARQRHHRVLIVEDRVPYPWLGSGLPRTKALVEAVSAYFQGLAHIIFCATAGGSNEWSDVHRVIGKDIEIVATESRAKLSEAIRLRKPDLILVCRPHNMGTVDKILEDETFGTPSRIIYDAEALFALRDIGKQSLLGEPITATEADNLVEAEIALTRRAHVLLTVSPGEKKVFERCCTQPVLVASHSVTGHGSPAGFSDRSDFLFVGAIHQDDTPNADSLLWFFREVWPIVTARLGGSVKLQVAGAMKSSIVKASCPPGVTFTGRVDDLMPLYESARVFIAPTRYAAGIPIKVLEASGAGLPCVISPLLSQQLDWSSGEQALVGGSPSEFAEACIKLYTERDLWERVQRHAQAAVGRDYSKTKFYEAVFKALDCALTGEKIAVSRGGISVQ